MSGKEINCPNCKEVLASCSFNGFDSFDRDEWEYEYECIPCDKKFHEQIWLDKTGPVPRPGGKLSVYNKPLSQINKELKENCNVKTN